jgi:hypothetical protein
MKKITATEVALLTRIREEQKSLIEAFERFEEKVNQYDISSDGIDDDNSMLKGLIEECRKLLRVINSGKYKELK